MANDPTQVVSYTATIVGVVSAIAAIASAISSFRSSNKSSEQFENNQRKDFLDQINVKLDEVYIELSKFIEEFSNSRETKQKRVVRDRIIYLVERLRVDFSSSKLTNCQHDTDFRDLSLKISDITYEKNFEKNMNDLSIVKNCISNLKEKLISLCS